MKGFEPYPQYKDSGVEWLGEIPESWITGRLKHLLTIRGGQDHKQVESEEQTPIPVIGSGGQFSYAVKPLYEGESVLLGRKGTIDKPLYVTGRFWTVDTMFYSEIHEHADGKFAYYAATTIPFGLYSTNTALPSMSQFDLSNHLIVFPGKSDQSQIARFLDHETGKIDGLIAEQEKLIELLKEKRQATISHAVTKGLNPDAPMKDSSVEWLGEVPEHWEIKPMKYMAKLNPAKSAYKGETGIACSFVPMEKLKTGSLELNETRVISEVFSSYTYFEENDVLCAKVTPCFENRNTAIATGLTNGVGFGSSEINVFRPFSINGSFLYFRLLENTLVEYWTSQMTGAGGLRRVPTETVETFKIAVPPNEEQIQIAQHLDRETAKLDTLLTEALRGIDLLKERRSALISAAVTGKIDVRNWKSEGEAT